jgi:hypothetical protein
MSKHTSEPWSFDKYDNTIAGDEMLLLGGIRTPMTAGPRMDEGRANARRIVTCVNACRGLTTEDLEYVGLVSAVGNQLLSADNRAEGQEREIRRLAHVAANAENELAGALNQLDELRAAMANIAHLKWRDHLEGLDRPTDFAEREAALRAFGDAQSIAREAIAKHEA